MANKRIDVVPISKEIILRNIENAGLSIRKVAEKTDRSEWTIRKYLNQGEMPANLIHQIDDAVRPKKHSIFVRFDTTIDVSDDELIWLLSFVEDFSEPILELNDIDAEALWDMKGRTEINGAKVDMTLLSIYKRRLAEKASILMGTNTKNKEDAKNGKGKI